MFSGKQTCLKKGDRLHPALLRRTPTLAVFSRNSSAPLLGRGKLSSGLVESWSLSSWVNANNSRMMLLSALYAHLSDRQVHVCAILLYDTESELLLRHFNFEETIGCLSAAALNLSYPEWLPELHPKECCQQTFFERTERIACPVRLAEAV